MASPKQPKRRTRRWDRATRSVMRTFGFLVVIWTSFLLTRDFVLSGNASFWFLSSAFGLGMIAFISSWWRTPIKQ